MQGGRCRCREPERWHESVVCDSDGMGRLRVLLGVCVKSGKGDGVVAAAVVGWSVGGEASVGREERDTVHVLGHFGNGPPGAEVKAGASSGSVLVLQECKGGAPG